MKIHWVEIARSHYSVHRMRFRGTVVLYPHLSESSWASVQKGQENYLTKHYPLLRRHFWSMKSWTWPSKLPMTEYFHNRKAVCVCSVLVLTGTELCYLVEMLNIADSYYCWVYFGLSAFVTDRLSLEYADYHKHHDKYLGQLWSLGRDSERPPSEASFAEFNWGHRLNVPFSGLGKIVADFPHQTECTFWSTKGAKPC